MNYFTFPIVLFLVLMTGFFLCLQNDHMFQDQKFAVASKYFLGSATAEPDIGKATSIWKRLARADHVPAQCFVGFLYLKGAEPIQPDTTMFQKWTTAASRENCMLAKALERQLIFDPYRKDFSHPLMRKDMTTISPTVALLLISQMEFKDEKPSLFSSLIFLALTIFYL